MKKDEEGRRRRMSSLTASTLSEDEEPLLREISDLVITTLNLEMSIDELTPDMTLFGDDGLGLDSIDALEIALNIEHRYGIKIEAEDDGNQSRFASVRTLAAFVATERTK